MKLPKTKHLARKGSMRIREGQFAIDKGNKQGQRKAYTRAIEGLYRKSDSMSDQDKSKGFIGVNGSTQVCYRFHLMKIVSTSNYLFLTTKINETNNNKYEKSFSEKTVSNNLVKCDRHFIRNSMKTLNNVKFSNLKHTNI